MSTNKKSAEAKTGQASAAKPAAAPAQKSSGAAAHSADAAKDNAAPVQDAPSILEPAPVVKPAPVVESEAATQGFFIRSVSKHGFRRCGFAFTHVGFGIAADVLKSNEIEILRKDPNLVVQECTFATDDTAFVAERG
ncbi:MAG: hypothetical protein GY938_13365 [Ketobacter sp.]|nr:hypothetical protein [Ketobacter sp.]